MLALVAALAAEIATGPAGVLATNRIYVVNCGPLGHVAAVDGATAEVLTKAARALRQRLTERPGAPEWAA